MNVYNPGNVLLVTKHKDKLGQKVTTWKANGPMMHVSPRFTDTDTCVYKPKIHPVNNPYRAEIRTPRNIINPVHPLRYKSDHATPPDVPSQHGID